MGRTLEALKRGHGMHSRPEIKIAPAPAFSDRSETGPKNGDEDEIPFIEVGGRESAVEGSKSVMAAAARQKKPVALEKAQESRQQCIPLPPRYSVEASEQFTVHFEGLPAVTGPASQSAGRMAPEVIAYHQPDHPLSRQYRSVLSGLVAQAPLGGAQALALAAATTGTGTTSVCVNLAVTHARQSKKLVVVVDANLRRPGIAGCLGLAEAPGLRDVLTGRFPLSRALRETAQPNLLALTSGESPANAAWPAAEAVRSVLCRLRKEVDLVLVDAPSWNQGPELASLVASCDAVYLVLRPSQIESPEVAEFLRLIPHVGGHAGGYIVAERGRPAKADDSPIAPATALRHA
jgi:Mrp family chromosome partitioning ATPase